MKRQKRVLLPVLAVLVTVMATASAFAAAGGLPKKRAFPTETGQARQAPRQPEGDAAAARRHLALADGDRPAPHPLGGAARHAPCADLLAPSGAPRAQAAARPPHRRGWLCIHHFEGSWRDGTTRTGAGCRWIAASCAATRRGCSSGAAGPTGGRRSSRCGSPSAPIAAGAASARGRTPPGTAASSKLSCIRPVKGRKRSGRTRRMTRDHERADRQR